MKEQSVQKGFSKKSAWEALLSCGQNQKAVQRVSREQCMCPGCFYRDIGEDGGCLFTATLENHQGLCMNYRGDVGCFPEILHYGSVDEDNVRERLFIWRHKELGDLACVLKDKNQALFSCEGLAALLGIKFFGFLKRYFRLLMPVRLLVPDDTSDEGCREVYFLDVLGLERALLLETAVDPQLRRVLGQELALVGVNIERLLEGKQALRLGIDVEVERDWEAL
ncbi:hypothetical protein [Eubacterium sp. 1001713B170207_170306_E7]|uniref:hypothetical protein n=1 Tax=Eubacterium sp. 1001713B170207_170306_E7 TaxID=2787097 RepID=UPI00189B270C|nr:hypothetical protein [Eubacterium sp. 1001713B170207_170306_E7]